MNVGSRASMTQQGAVCCRFLFLLEM